MSVKTGRRIRRKGLYGRYKDRGPLQVIYEVDLVGGRKRTRLRSGNG